MSGDPVFHVDILNSAQKKVLPGLAKAFDKTDFYMAGGTALALQIGHRPSVDFDWFIPKLGDPEILFTRLKSFNIPFEVQSISFETVYLMVDAVQMSFIGYDYPLIKPKLFWSDYRICLAQTLDIACMKLSAIASRGSRKDFIDLYFLINHYYPLEFCLQSYIQKYQNRDIGHVVRSLIYFDDAENEPGLEILMPFDWAGLKSDFKKWIKDLEF